MNSKLKIIFLNHASFIIQYNNTKILVDPYLFGEAFNNGWNLLKEFYIFDFRIKLFSFLRIKI